MMEKADGEVEVMGNLPRLRIHGFHEVSGHPRHEAENLSRVTTISTHNVLMIFAELIIWIY